MKNIIAVFYVCLAVVTCQSPSRPPPPPSNDLTKPSLPETPKKDPSAQVYPPRPKGCSPGCGPTEICAELGASYCRLNEACSVCIKMSSIRFPASALAGMFSQQKPQAAVPAQELPVQQGPDSPLDYATIQRMWQQQQQQLDQVYQQQPQQLDQVYQVNPNTPTHVSYVPQQPVVNNYNDPFDIFGFNDPIPPQQNQVQNNIQVPMNNNNINSNQGVNAHNNDPLFGLMMFEGLGFGGGFGLGF